MNKAKLCAKVVNALKWQAVADALGDTFEFQSNPKHEDLDALIKASTPLEITDDTQMTLFGFEAVVRGFDSGRVYLSDTALLGEVKNAYLRWLQTQTLKAVYASNVKKNDGLLAYQSLYKRKAPGMTCLASLQKLMEGGVVSNASNGCGGVMRGLPFIMTPSSFLALTSTALTHLHPEALEVAMLHHNYCRQLLLWGKASSKLPSDGGIDKLENFFDAACGGGWTARSCFEIALEAVVTSDSDYTKMLHTAIVHPGDSDSTGAVAGAIFGLAYDIAPPQNLFNRIKEKDAIYHVIKLIHKAYGLSV